MKHIQAIIILNPLKSWILINSNGPNWCQSSSTHRNNKTLIPHLPLRAAQLFSQLICSRFNATAPLSPQRHQRWAQLHVPTLGGDGVVGPALQEHSRGEEAGKPTEAPMQPAKP